jgi:sulfide:quinone oxidoreductase
VCVCVQVDVDQQTLQHKKFPNIFALGDCAALPTVKSVAGLCTPLPSARCPALSSFHP